MMRPFPAKCLTIPGAGVEMSARARPAEVPVEEPPRHPVQRRQHRGVRAEQRLESGQNARHRLRLHGEDDDILGVELSGVVAGLRVRDCSAGC
jgi:hypothetical protein